MTGKRMGQMMLIAAGFAVCHFAPRPEDLQRSYLASL